MYYFYQNLKTYRNIYLTLQAKIALEYTTQSAVHLYVIYA